MSDDPAQAPLAQPSAAQRAAAQTMLLDTATLEVSELLQRAGVDSLLLKGPALAAWLYPTEGRPYGDIDLLVAPHLQSVATEALLAEGFVDVAEGSAPGEFGGHATTFARGPVTVDLHHRLVGVADGAALWERFWPRHVALDLGRGSVRALGREDQLLVVLLHAVQHGQLERKPLEDLRRAANAVDESTVLNVIETADLLDCREAVLAALDMCEEFRLRFPLLARPARSLSTRTRIYTSQQQPGALVLADVLTGSPAVRLRALRRALWPSQTYLSVWPPTRDVSSRFKRRAVRVGYVLRVAPSAVGVLRGVARDSKADPNTTRPESTP